MDQDLIKKLDDIAAKVEATYQSAEKTRKYIWWMVVIAIAVTVIPLFILPLVAGSFLSSYSTASMF